MRRRLLIALAIVTPAGFATKLYAGPAADWVRYFAGGVLYEVFFVLGVLFVWPRTPVARAALAVFLGTSAIEILQLWRPPWLVAIRSTFLGGTLLGTTFSWWDFPHYAIGCVGGAWLGRRLRAGARREPRGQASEAAGGSAAPQSRQ